MIKARKDAKMWRECFNRQSKYCRPKIKDKIAKLSFVALLLTMTAAIFYTPTGN